MEVNGPLVAVLYAADVTQNAHRGRRAVTQPFTSEKATATATATASLERTAAVLTNQGVWRGSRGGMRQEMKLSMLLPWAASVQTNRGGISLQTPDFDFNGFYGQEWLLFNSQVPVMEATFGALRATAEQLDLFVEDTNMSVPSGAAALMHMKHKKRHTRCVLLQREIFVVCLFRPRRQTDFHVNKRDVFNFLFENFQRSLHLYNIF